MSERGDMRRCWWDAGLTEEGALRADAILAPMVKLVERAGGEVARTVLKEAIFRVEELPKRSEAFCGRYFKDEKRPARANGGKRG